MRIEQDLGSFAQIEIGFNKEEPKRFYIELQDEELDNYWRVYLEDSGASNMCKGMAKVLGLSVSKKGKWLVEPDGSGARCTECGGEEDYPRYFCGWCGADMRVMEGGRE